MADETRWQKVVRWYHAVNLRTVLMIEWIADSGIAFVIMALVAVVAGVLLITLTTWAVRV